jgi:hypothetical protein
MLQPGSNDFEGLVNQMQIMQSFIAPSEMLDRMDQGEQIPPEDIYAAAAQQYVDRVEELRRDFTSKKRRLHLKQVRPSSVHEPSSLFLSFLLNCLPNPLLKKPGMVDHKFCAHTMRMVRMFMPRHFGCHSAA